MEANQRFPCSECPFVAVSSADLATHQRSAHTGLKPCKRQDCPARFASKREVNAHLVTAHNYVRCKDAKCSKVFQAKSRMEKHWEKHPKGVPGVVPRVKDRESEADDLAEETMKFLREVADVTGRTPETFYRMTAAIISSSDTQRFPLALCMHALEVAQNLPAAVTAAGPVVPVPPAELPAPVPVVSNPPSAPIPKPKKRRRVSEPVATDTTATISPTVASIHHKRKSSCMQCSLKFDSKTELHSHFAAEHETKRQSVAANPQIATEVEQPTKPPIVQVTTAPAPLSLFCIEPAQVTVAPAPLSLLCIEPPCQARFHTPKELLDHVETEHYNSKQCP